MRVVTREIILPSLTTPFTITFLGDTHVGAVDCHEPLLKACIAEIAKGDRHYWIGMGDYGEWIIPGDKRHDYKAYTEDTKALQLADAIGLQLSRIVDPFSAIKDKCLGMIEGNHEQGFSSRTLIDVQDRIAAAMESEASFDPVDKIRNCNLTYSCIMRLAIRSDGDNAAREVMIYLHHGAGGGRKTGSKVNRIEEQAATFPECNIYVMGHVHERVITLKPSLIVKPRTNKIENGVRVFGITGTFKKTYEQDFSSYGERAQYPPTALGCISITIVPEYSRKRLMRFIPHNTSDGLPT